MNLREEYRDHRVGAHRYKTVRSTGEDQWAVHVDGVLVAKEVANAARAHVRQMEMSLT
jgi:hypothetical protein